MLSRINKSIYFKMALMHCGYRRTDRRTLFRTPLDTNLDTIYLGQSDGEERGLEADDNIIINVVFCTFDARWSAHSGSLTGLECRSTRVRVPVAQFCFYARVCIVSLRQYEIHSEVGAVT